MPEAAPPTRLPCLPLRPVLALSQPGCAPPAAPLSTTQRDWPRAPRRLVQEPGKQPGAAGAGRFARDPNAGVCCGEPQPYSCESLVSVLECRVCQAQSTPANQAAHRRCLGRASHAFPPSGRHLPATLNAAPDKASTVPCMCNSNTPPASLGQVGQDARASKHRRGRLQLGQGCPGGGATGQGEGEAGDGKGAG